MKIFLMAISWANLMLLQEWFNLLPPDNVWSRYEFPSATAQGVLVIWAVWAGLAGAFLGVDRWMGADGKNPASRWRATAWVTLLALSVVIPLLALRNQTQLSNHWPWLSAHGALQVAPLWAWLLVALVTLCMGVWQVHRHLTKAQAFVTGALLVLSPLAAVTFSHSSLRLGYALTHPIPPTAPFFLDEQRPPGRVVWIVFDEWDERLSFEQRPADLDLPHLDRFRRESTVAAHALSPAPDTIHALPALITGKQVAGFEATSPRRAQVQFQADSPWIAWHETPTVFHRMNQHGANTAIVGWFHAYCKLFQPLVQKCVRGSRIAHTYTEPWGVSLASVLSRLVDPTRDRHLHQRLYQHLAQASAEVIADPRFNFVFAHLNIPHPPFIYNLHTQRLSSRQPQAPHQYFANLKLVDEAWGRLRKEIETAGLWDESTIVLTSDHPWRAAADYDGQTDPRVPWMAKLANQNTAHTITVPIHTLHTAQLVEDLVRGDFVSLKSIGSRMQP